MSKNTITWPSVMHVDANGNVTHQDLTLTFDPALRAWSCDWPKHLHEQRIDNFGSPQHLVDHFEFSGERYQSTLLLLLANSANKLSVRCTITSDSEDGIEGAELVVRVRKASVLSDGTVYLHCANGSVKTVDADFPGHFLVDDTPEVRERLTKIGQSIQLAGELLSACETAPDPTAALLAIRFCADDPAGCASQKLVDPNQPDLFDQSNVEDEEL